MASTWSDRARTRLSQLASACNYEGWDSYGATALRAEALEYADKLVDVLSVRIIDVHGEAYAPQITPLNAGGIQFEWGTPAGCVELEVYGPNCVEILLQREGGDPLCNDSLVDLLKKVLEL